MSNRRRRLSEPPVPSNRVNLSCSSSLSTLAALDLSSASATHTLASLRFLVLTYLETLERCLSDSDSPAKSQWAHTALDMLGQIRQNVVSHLPSVLPHLWISDLSGVEAFIRDHWPTELALPALPTLSLLSLSPVSLPPLQLPKLVVDEKKLEEARDRFHDLVFEFHPSYYSTAIDTLSKHLGTLHSHLEQQVSGIGEVVSAYAPLAEALQGLVNEAKAMLDSSAACHPPLIHVDGYLPRTLMADVRESLEGFEANMQAITLESSEIVLSALEDVRTNMSSSLTHLRSEYTHIKEGMQSNFSYVKDEFNHELAVISKEMHHIGHELSVLKEGLEHELEGVMDEVRRAVMRSVDGIQLIRYADLPHEWKNNPFVVHGYRFIPVERWGLILKSVFEAHNETLNIHTHLIPFLLWFSNLVLFRVSGRYLAGVPERVSAWVSKSVLPVVMHAYGMLPEWAVGYVGNVGWGCVTAFQGLSTAYSILSTCVNTLPTPPFPLSITPLIQQRMAAAGREVIVGTTKDPIELAFISFSLLCLFASAVWHTMSGCADRRSMEFCARVDYIGIGWLISATVATVAFYGFEPCHPLIARIFLGVCFCTGAMGNVFPFMEWFNMHEYRLYRVAFFLAMGASGLAPMLMLGVLHSWKEAYDFVSPIFPSLLSYVIGLVFYATHTPERFLPPSVRRKLDVVGGSSHAIWHCFIVLAVSQHKAAIGLLKEGVKCVV